jgi:hypothetical protein
MREYRSVKTGQLLEQSRKYRRRLHLANWCLNNQLYQLITPAARLMSLRYLAGVKEYGTVQNL